MLPSFLLTRSYTWKSLYIESEIIDDEGRTDLAIFQTDQIHLHRLPLVRRHIERMLRIPARRIQIAERPQRPQYRVAVAAHLHREGIVNGRGIGLGGIDMQVEAQGRGRNVARQRHLLEQQILARGGIAAQPGFPGAAVRRFGAGTVDDACRSEPGTRVGRPILEAGIAQQLGGNRRGRRWGAERGEIGK